MVLKQSVEMGDPIASRDSRGMPGRTRLAKTTCSGCSQLKKRTLSAYSEEEASRGQGGNCQNDQPSIMERGLRKSRVQERSRKTRERKWRLRKRVYIYMDSESHPGRKSWQSHSHGQEHSIKTSEVYQEEMKKQKSLPAVFCGGCFTGLSCLGLPRPQ